MFTLQIEHSIKDYDSWKKLFDSDPVNRKQSGVKRYSIFRQTDNPNHVIISLEFANLNEAEAVHDKLKKLWSGLDGSVMINPHARIIETTESKEL